MTITTESAWLEFSDRLRRFIGARMPASTDPDDVLSEVFVKVHTRIDTLEDEGRLAPWLFQITRNTITDHYRRKRPDSRELSDIDIEVVEDEALGSESISGSVRHLIEKLPDKYRDALILTEFEGLTQQQLAERLGLSTSGAKSRVQRARSLLRDELLACCHFEFDRRGGVISYSPRRRCCEPAAAVR